MGMYLRGWGNSGYVLKGVGEQWPGMYLRGG